MIGLPLGHLLFYICTINKLPYNTSTSNKQNTYNIQYRYKLQYNTYTYNDNRTTPTYNDNRTTTTYNENYTTTTYPLNTYKDCDEKSTSH